ncbi:hypothetical protein PV325_004226 [Microctonus aethiopoides]|uniref:Small ribosomal subunit protein mS23 n=1 Tax=Microctonus aethiopoides TaxID=144406 RepID=A0AA39FPC1_9HYME|nr:hypothetical protein PV325_004226 [Microctonus aethiopoides]KAK0094525.1 hypothetical protein PV326_010680 [Microctonus aethiopoides]KAK0173060.1 hypothetical protein PV328_006313 [Microctonus aethiopoides]
MAQSRLERIGTIFSRVTNLMKGGAMKPEDQPMWYVIYKAFPPKQEPRFDRAAPNIEIKDIFYKEDIIRAKFHGDNKKVLFYNLEKDDESHTQKFIKIYQGLEKEKLPESEHYKKACKIFHEQNLTSRVNQRENSTSISQSTTPTSTQNVETHKIEIKKIFEN